LVNAGKPERNSPQSDMSESNKTTSIEESRFPTNWTLINFFKFFESLTRQLTAQSGLDCTNKDPNKRTWFQRHERNYNENMNWLLFQYFTKCIPLMLKTRMSLKCIIRSKFGAVQIGNIILLIFNNLGQLVSSYSDSCALVLSRC
jgi:hypothetical protein